MKQVIAFFLIAFSLISCSQAQLPDSLELKSGDILFQDFNSGLNTPIKLITKSKYSHVGMVVMVKGKPQILEAVQPVRLADPKEWINRHPKGEFVVKRHKKADSIITPEIENKLEAFYKKQLGKNYDIKFAWTDNDMYCSELVWKVYNEVFHLNAGKQQKLKDLDASHPAVQAKLKELFGDNIPWEETVVSPQDIFICRDLKTIYQQ